VRAPEEQVSQGAAGEAASEAATAGLADAVAASWLSDSLLLIVGAPALRLDDSRATLLAGEEPLELRVRSLSLGLNGSSERNVLTAALGDGADAAHAAGRLSLPLPGADGEDGGVELRFTPPAKLVHEQLSGLDEGTAKQVAEFISAAPAAHGLGETRDLRLSNALHAVRNQLRPRLPAVAIEAAEPLTGNIDQLVTIDEMAFFVKGWIRDGEAPIVRLTAVAPEGERIQMIQRVHRLELQEFEVFAQGPYRDPVDAYRFFAYFETTRASRLRKPWVFEVQNETGRAAELYALPDPPDPATARETILRSIPAAALPDEELMSEHVHPAIARQQERARESLEVAHVVNHGQLPEAPEVSIVVPLYKRIDLVEHQLLQFNSDPEIKSAELIYVLDSPELENDLADRARQLARLFQVPFRIVTMRSNVGFGAATNAGMSIGRGRLLVLLNSDVLPAAPGWLGTMQAFYDSTPDIGALGPKLLYEDDSLQHAGLYFDMVLEGPTAGSWANRHYYKGLHKDLPAANVPRAVPAVTAACLMIGTELYREMGGLPDVYVRGDYEDSDLCLALVEAGRENWYLPTAELYHLEGSSYSDTERGITGSYNRWLQTHRRGGTIADVMARFPRG
jgi:O-antigen biosynthesis protein